MPETNPTPWPNRIVLQVDGKRLRDAVRAELRAKPLTIRQRLRLIQRAFSPKPYRLGEAFEQGMRRAEHDMRAATRKASNTGGPNR